MNKTNLQQINHPTIIDRRISIAPMMEWTDRHYRYLMRLIAPKTLLYTEMVHCGAVIHGDRERFLSFDSIEYPLAIQLGGSDPKEMAQSAVIAEAAGFDEVNINVGCPSDRVQSGAFGACLFKEPERVADCVRAMKAVVSIPVTVKTRVGVDDIDNYEHLFNFIDLVASAGCEIFIVHARKAWLSGLSPKENRTVPKLQYDRVYQLKRDFPQLSIIVNGGIQTLAAAHSHLQHLDGIMVGREAYQNCFFIHELEHSIYGEEAIPLDRMQILRQFLPYVKEQHAIGVPLSNITRHMLGLFRGVSGAKNWRRDLSEDINSDTKGIRYLETLLEGQSSLPSL